MSKPGRTTKAAEFVDSMKAAANKWFAGEKVEFTTGETLNRGTLSITAPDEGEPQLILNFNYFAGGTQKKNPSPTIIKLEFLGVGFDQLMFEAFLIDCEKKWRPREKLLPEKKDRRLSIMNPKSPAIASKILRACKFALDHYQDPHV